MPADNGQQEATGPLLTEYKDDNYQPTKRRMKPANWYVRLLANHPYVVPPTVVIVITLCTVFAARNYPLPNLDPTVGFTPRGTQICGAYTAQRHLARVVSEGKILTATPNMTLNIHVDIDKAIDAAMDTVLNIRKRHSFLHVKELPFVQKDLERHEELQGDRHNQEIRRYSRNADAFACARNNIDIKSTMVVFETATGENLFTAAGLRSICKLEESLILPGLTFELPCRMHSVSYYVSALRHKKCSDLDDTDVHEVKKLIKTCAPFYFNHSLKGNCDGSHRCKSVPKKCLPYNAVYKLLYFLTDINFIKPNDFDTMYLRYALLVYQKMEISPPWHIYYRQNIMTNNQRHGYVQLSGAKFGKTAMLNLFNYLLLSDMKYFIIAMIAIFVLMISYVRSLVLLAATTLNIFLSFGLAYFLYFVVFRFDFFPFMNLLALLILIAVGADDVFIFYDAWKHAKRSSPYLPMEQWVSRTFHHAAMSILITSLTTAAAFFANYNSTITAVCCFGVFSGLAVLSNFFMMITWTPAIIIMVDKATHSCCSMIPNMHLCMARITEKMHSSSSVVFSKWIPVLVTKAWWAWLIVLTAIGFGSCYIAFYNPRLKLPSTTQFQMFSNGHPMEKWRNYLKMEFQAYVDKEHKSHRANIPIWFTWGIKPIDNGNVYNPESKGKLEMDPTFDLLDKNSQVWMSKFCRKLLNQTFILAKYRKRSCFFDALMEITAKCSKPTTKLFFVNCCKLDKFPYDPKKLSRCLPEIAKYIFIVDHKIVGSPIFNMKGTIKAFAFPLETAGHFSMNFEAMDKIYPVIQKFIEKEKEQAPPGVKNGFFTGIGWFTLYDMQLAISSGTYFSIVFSVLVALVVMLLTSRNVLITVYAILTIGLAITSTVATIVLLGWELNILESMCISLSVGLSIDFTIHYGMAYRLSCAPNKQSRVQEAFSRVGFAVFMACLTTFIAGSAAVPSSILAYTRLGLFLVIVMTCAWVYATFFFQSLCYTVGPHGTFCQVPSPLEICSAKNSKKNWSYKENIESSEDQQINYDNTYLFTF